MPNRFKIPDIATKYILFQRTGYLTRAGTFILRILRKLIPGFDFNQMVSIEAKLRSVKVREMYLTDMQNEYLAIKEFLPEKCHGILDIGCGVAGIDLFLNEHYKNGKVDFFLLDKTRIDEKVYYMYENKGSFYNSLELARQILLLNDINKDNIYLIEATDDNSINLNTSFDLILSLISWGFHYPVNTYLDKVYNLLSVGGVLILDIRKSTDGLDLITRLFGEYQIILETEKYQRVYAIKLVA